MGYRAPGLEPQVFLPYSKSFCWGQTLECVS